MRNTAGTAGGKPIAVFLQSISGVIAINPLVAFYDLHGGKREVLFFLSRILHETLYLDVFMNCLYYFRHNEDGSYTYGYEAADGSFKIETKSPSGEVKGKYGYKDDTGKVYQLTS
jgi:hypothetical protein